MYREFCALTADVILGPTTPASPHAPKDLWLVDAIRLAVAHPTSWILRAAAIGARLGISVVALRMTRG
jgi:hypothetical protein